jgi:CheY-like chemotaxis protein
MHTVLIVEDDEDKAERIAAFIGQEYANVDIKFAKSLQSGLRSAFSEPFDLMLLDMTMSNFDRSITEDGGRPHYFAGREILRRLQRDGINIPTIVVTQFGRFGEEAEQVTLSELKSELKIRFEDYVGTVQYQSNIDEWKNDLVKLIDSRLEKKGPL